MDRDVYCKIHGFAMVQPCRDLAAPLSRQCWNQNSDAKGLQLGVPRALSHCLRQQREQAITPAAGCGVFVCFLITQAGDLPSSFNLPFPPALCPYQIPPGIASLPASFFPKPCYEIQLLRDVVKIPLLGKESPGLSHGLILFHGQEFIVDLNLRPGNVTVW